MAGEWFSRMVWYVAESRNHGQPSVGVGVSGGSGTTGNNGLSSRVVPKNKVATVVCGSSRVRGNDEDGVSIVLFG